MTNMAVQGSEYFYFCLLQVLAFQLTILIMFSLLVSVKNLSYFPFQKDES